MRLCMLVILFWPGPFVECCALIGCYFPNDNSQLREILAMHSGAFKLLIVVKIVINVSLVTFICVNYQNQEVFSF